MSLIRNVILMTLVAMSLFCSAALASPELGDDAPKLGITGWLGDAPASVPGDDKAKDHVFVVAFWASWHNRSLAVLPMLHELQTEFADKPLIVIAITNEEASDAAVHTKTDAANPASFALDGNVVATETWADDVDIPIAYVITKDNKIAWKGDPGRRPGEVSQTVRKVLDGSFDMEAARNADQTEQKFLELQNQLQAAFGTGKEPDVFKIIDEMIKLRPKDLHSYLIKRQMIHHFKSYQRLPALLSRIEKVFADSPPDLARLIDVELTFEYENRHAPFMMRCADRLRILVRDRDPYALDMIARVYAECGLFDEAVDNMEKAIAVSPPGEEKDGMKRRLAYLKTVRDIAEQRKSAAGQPKESVARDSSE